MFLKKFDENLATKENRYGLEESLVDGSIRFSFFQAVIFFFKADFPKSVLFFILGKKFSKRSA